MGTARHFFSAQQELDAIGRHQQRLHSFTQEKWQQQQQRRLCGRITDDPFLDALLDVLLDALQSFRQLFRCQRPLGTYQLIQTLFLTDILKEEF